MDTENRQLQLYEEVLNFYFNKEHQASPQTIKEEECSLL
jgi:hypothetical protein